MLDGLVINALALVEGENDVADLWGHVLEAAEWARLVVGVSHV